MSIFNNKDFYPTPPDVAQMMLQQVNVTDKVVLEPSMGKGDLVDVIRSFSPKEILGCEKSDELRAISRSKVDRVLTNDFLELNKNDVSHIDCIIANPPFSSGAKHLLKMWDIAPEGCEIVCLINRNTLQLDYSKERLELNEVIKTYGTTTNLGEAFTTAERKTHVEVSMVYLFKPITDEEDLFDFYFDMDSQHEPNSDIEGIMPHNNVREIVNRYVGAIKYFDEVNTAQKRMNALIEPLNSSYGAIKFTAKDRDKNEFTYESFRIELQKNAWSVVFNKLGAEKYMTESLKGDLNRFVEQQRNVPFTMSNIYKMLQLVIGTHGQRMEKVVVQVFDWLTEHHHGNRFQKEGWKTNSEYIVNERFIIPYVPIDVNFSNGMPQISYMPNHRAKANIDDLMKALCYLTGKEYTQKDSIRDLFNYGELVENCEVFDGVNKDAEVKEGYERLESTVYGATKTFIYKKDPDYLYQINNNSHQLYRYKRWGKWFNWNDLLDVRIYKKGTVHGRFRDKKVWKRFNQSAAKSKGFQLASKFTSDYRAKGNEVTLF